MFDGRKLHRTRPFEGERYSLVFFCGPNVSKAPSLVRTELHEAGFDFDWDEGAVALVGGSKLRTPREQSVEE